MRICGIEIVLFETHLMSDYDDYEKYSDLLLSLLNGNSMNISDKMIILLMMVTGKALNYLYVTPYISPKWRIII